MYPVNTSLSAQNAILSEIVALNVIKVLLLMVKAAVARKTVSNVMRMESARNVTLDSLNLENCVLLRQL